MPANSRFVAYHLLFARVYQFLPQAVAILLLIAALVQVQRGFAQDVQGPSISNFHQDTLAWSDTLRFGEHAIFQHTLTATPLSPPGTKSLATAVDPKGKYAFVTDAPPTGVEQPDTPRLVRWTYRTLESELNSPLFRLDSLRLRNTGPLNRGFSDYNAGISVGDLRRELGDIDYRGTFGRGLRFGNSQSLVLDSRLDLQLDGQLGDGLSIEAVVSDQNIPLQPAGNTVQLQEFDRIFVTVAKGEHSLTAGDYNLASTAAHFVRFDKNLQGLTYRYSQQPGGTAQGLEEPSLQGRASLAAARGQFSRIQLPVSDGNQGPYRLTGTSNQPFIIVLAGTERITLDGRLLERGIDRDYTIDYNRGEVTFMPRLLINRFQRILVEYEFVDREYLRSLVTADAAYQHKAWSFYVSGLQQQDGLRRTTGALSNSAEQRLRDSPGDPTGVLVPSATLLPEDSANPIRYIRLPSPAPTCSDDSIFVYQTSSSDAEVYGVSFTEVGAGNGDYVLSRASSANGPIFEYIAPTAACEHQGNYAALRRVQTPRALRLLTLGGALRPDTSFGVSWEVVGNQVDANRYNPSQATSLAGYMQLDKIWSLGSGQLTTQASLEGTGDRFEAIAPWRPAEFNRTWNLGNLAVQQTELGTTERLANFTAAYAQKATRLAYTVSQYNQGQAYSGFRQNWQAGTRLGRWQVQHQGSSLDARRGTDPTRKLDLEVGASTRSGRWLHAFGAQRLTTKNYDLVLDATGDVDRELAEWYAESSRVAVDSLWTPRVRYQGRVDFLQVQDQRSGDGLNHQVEVGLSSPTRRRNNLDVTATYRYSENAAGKPERYYLGRVAHRYRAGRSGWLSLQTTAETGSGQERRVALQYIRVQPGLGQYVWRDYDNDGVEDLGEFEVAVFSDSAAYIRTTLLTDEFVATNTLGVNQSINIDLGRRSVKRTGILSRLSALNTTSLKRRAVQAAGFERLLAVNLPAADTSIVGDDLAWRSALYLNRARNAFRAELEHRQLANRAISLQGLQQLRTNGLTAKLMYPLGDAWRLLTELDRERRRSRSEGLADRNFTIQTRSVAPGLRFQPSTKIRMELTASYREGNSLDGSSSVVARGLSLETDVQLPERAGVTGKSRGLAGATLRGSVRRVDQRFSGEADAPAGFALLEGLQPGRSWIWNLTADQQVGRALQLSLRYDGRQLGKGRVVHTGQAQLQAVF